MNSFKLEIVTPTEINEVENLEGVLNFGLLIE